VTVVSRARVAQQLATLRSAVQLGWCASPRLFVEAGVLAVGTAAIPPVALALGRRFVDLAAAGGTGRVVATVAISLGATEWLNQSLSARAMYRQQTFSDVIAAHARSRFLATAIAIDVAHYDDPASHDRMARAGGELSSRVADLQRNLFALVGHAITLAGVLGLLAGMHPALVLLSLLTIVPQVFVRRSTNRQLHQLWMTRTPASREQDYLAEILSRPRWAREVRAFVLGEHLRRRHDNIAARHIAHRRHLFERAERFAVLGGVMGGAALAGVYLFVAGQAARGRLTPGDLTIVIGALALISARISMASLVLLGVREQLAVLGEYFAFVAMRPEAGAVGAVSSRSDRRGIEFERVTFTYPRSAAPALRDVSLRVTPGELLAIVGDNGAGKSTLVRLLLRFYDPDEGCVRFDGVDARELDPAGIRSRIGVLFQDFAQYELTAADNVAFGRVDAEPSDSTLMRAVRAADAEDILRRLPNGLQSHVGRLFEGGHDLSGGEWQRLALARLIYRNADVWVLDEPTAALDPEAEASVFAELRAHLTGRVGIVISHRFSTVRFADRIVVMQQGRIAEQGTHAELLALGGRYAELFELQAAAYR
jgi:ATP-binding cassette subfamily B protein